MKKNSPGPSVHSRIRRTGHQTAGKKVRSILMDEEESIEFEGLDGHLLLKKTRFFDYIFWLSSEMAGIVGVLLATGILVQFFCHSRSSAYFDISRMAEMFLALAADGRTIWHELGFFFRWKTTFRNDGNKLRILSFLFRVSLVRFETAMWPFLPWPVDGEPTHRYSTFYLALCVCGKGKDFNHLSTPPSPPFSSFLTKAPNIPYLVENAAT